MRWGMLLWVVLCPAIAGAQAPVEVKEETRVAVLELRAEGLDATLADNLSELFTSEAGRVPGYKVISHSEIVEMLGFEAKKQSLGCDDEGCMAELGGALGVSLIITGTIGQVGDTYVVTIKLIDIDKAQTKNRVAETLVGRVELLPPFMRIAAWRLFEQPVPPEVTAGYDTTKARLNDDAARAAGDKRALADSERVKLEAERMKAEAERAKAETERLRLQNARESRATKSTPSEPQGRIGGGKRKKKEETGPAWPRIGRTVSSLVAGLGLLGGGTLHAVSYIKARDVGEVGAAEGGTDATVYDVGTQSDAQLAGNLRGYALYGYAAGAVGVVAFVVFTILQPDAPEEADATAVRVVPTGNGLAVTF